MLECEAHAMAAKEEQYLRVKEASELLGTAPNTLRTWGAAGKIDEYRHPINNYRLYLACARKFFSKITSNQVKYDVVHSYGKLMELVQ